MKGGFESKGSKVNLGKTKVMVSGSITKDGLFGSKFDPCWVCRSRVMTDSVLYVQCCMMIHCTCAGAKSVTTKSSRNIVCRKCEWNIGGSGAGRNVM